MIDEANDVELFSGMVSAQAHACMGPLPQGRLHLALIQAAFAIGNAERDGGR